MMMTMDGAMMDEGGWRHEGIVITRQGNNVKLGAPASSIASVLRGAAMTTMTMTDGNGTMEADGLTWWVLMMHQLRFWNVEDIFFFSSF
jgi:hypothetical protein